MDSYEVKRKNMVENQIRNRGIYDVNILNAMLRVERHKFVPEDKMDEAYLDRPVSIGEGQTISQPYIVALMSELLDLEANKRVLEIGTGSGYQTAILAEISNSVYTIEINNKLGECVARLFKSLGYENIFFKIDDGYKGWADYSPFDGIIVTCSPTHIPEILIEQLSEGGKMIIPVGGSYSQSLLLLQKINNKLVEKEITGVIFVPMINIYGRKY